MGVLDRITGLFRTDPAPAAEPEARAPAAAPGAVPGSKDEVVAELRHMVAELSDEPLRPDEVDPHASLLGEALLDSIAGVQLLVEIEERYGVVIEEVELAGGLNSIDEIAARVLELAAASGR